MPACFSNGELDMGKTAEIDHLVGVLKEAAAKAEKHQITIGLESYLSAEDNVSLLDRVGSPAMKVYYDVGNSTDKGRNVLKEIPILGKRICEFHFKDGGYMLGPGTDRFQEGPQGAGRDRVPWLDPDRSGRPARAVPGLRGPLQVLEKHLSGHAIEETGICAQCATAWEPHAGIARRRIY